jgi:hypothetical protein
MPLGCENQCEAKARDQVPGAGNEECKMKKEEEKRRSKRQDAKDELPVIQHSALVTKEFTPPPSVFM